MVSLFLLLSSVALTGCFDDGIEYNTPEERYETYMEILNLHDGRAAVKMMDISLTRDESLDDLKTQIIEHIDAGGANWTEHQLLRVRYEEDMTEDELELFAKLREAYGKEPLELELQDHCFVDQMVIREDVEREASLPMVKLKGIWYFAIYQHTLSGQGSGTRPTPPLK